MAAKPTRQDAGRRRPSPLLTGESGQPVMRKSEDDDAKRCEAKSLGRVIQGKPGQWVQTHTGRRHQQCVAPACVYIEHSDRTLIGGGQEGLYRWGSKEVAQVADVANALLRRWVISQSSDCRAVVDEPFGLSFGALDGVRLDDVDYDADADAGFDLLRESSSGVVTLVRCGP